MAKAPKAATPVAPLSNWTGAASYRERIEANLDQIQVDVADLNSALFGDKGYVVVKSKAAWLRPELPELAQWVPGDDNNEMEQAINIAHTSSGAKDNPAVRAQYKDAMFLAVHAATEEVAKEARIGRDKNGKWNDKPAYRTVVTRDFGSDTARMNLKDGAEAKAIMADRIKRAREAFAAMSEPAANAPAHEIAAYRDAKEVATLWSTVEAAGDTVDGLRWIGARDAALGVAIGRFRNLLFVNVVAPRLEEYSKSDTTRPVGEVWDPALGRAKGAHKSWIAAQFKDIADGQEASVLADLPNRIEGPDGLAAAMAKAVDEYLQPMITGTKAAAKSTTEEVLSRKLFGAARAAQRHFKIKGLVDELRKMLRDFAAEGLVDPNEKDEEKRTVATLSTAVQARVDTKAVADANAADRNTAKQARVATAETNAAGKVAGKVATGNGKATPAAAAPKAATPAAPKGPTPAAAAAPKSVSERLKLAASGGKAK